MDLKQHLNSLYGSCIVDTAISQVFGTSPIDLKIREIGEILRITMNISEFDYYLDLRSLTYNCKVWVEGYDHYFTITVESLRNETVENIVAKISNDIMIKHVVIDFENMFENENEQAMLDAAMDYGFV